MHQADTKFIGKHAQSNDHNGGHHHGQRQPLKEVILALGLARILVSIPVVRAHQKQGKVGQVAGLAAKKVAVFARVGQTLVLACPFALSLVIIAQTRLFGLLGGVGKRQTDGQGRFQLGDGLSLEVHQGDIQNGAAQLLVRGQRHIGRYAADKGDGECRVGLAAQGGRDKEASSLRSIR